MQPLEVLEAFDAELVALGFEEPIEGRIEAELLRRLTSDPVLFGYLTGGIYPVEAEELDDEKGKAARSLYLALASVQQNEEVGGASQLLTNWLAGLVTDRKASAIGTGRLRRMAVVRRIKSAIYGDDHAALSDDQGDLTMALVRWGAVAKPALYPGGALLVTLMPFQLESHIVTEEGG